MLHIIPTERKKLPVSLEDVGEALLQGSILLRDYSIEPEERLNEEWKVLLTPNRYFFDADEILFGIGNTTKLTSSLKRGGTVLVFTSELIGRRKEFMSFSPEFASSQLRKAVISYNFSITDNPLIDFYNLAAHSLAHIYGLQDHCKSFGCLMFNLPLSIKLGTKLKFCDYCSGRLERLGVKIG